MKQGKLFYDKSCGRYNFYYKEGGLEMDYEGIHCGEAFEFNLNGIWVPARVEMDDDWYLVGLPGLMLEGLEVRRK